MYISWFFIISGPDRVWHQKDPLLFSVKALFPPKHKFSYICQSKELCLSLQTRHICTHSLCYLTYISQPNNDQIFAFDLTDTDIGVKLPNFN